MKRKTLVLYLCDGKDSRCSGIKGCRKDCFHTAKIENAINKEELKDVDPLKDVKRFRKYVTDDGDVWFFERRLSCTAPSVEEEPK